MTLEKTPIVAVNVHDFSGDNDAKNNTSSGSGVSNSNNNSSGPTSGSSAHVNVSPLGNTSTTGGHDDLPLVDYNELAKQGKFNEALFRDEQIIQLLGVLVTKKKPNAILVGDAGVGKTQIVEEIARRLVNGDPIVNALLKDMTIYELPLAQLVAGKSYVGQLEQSVTEIIDFASDPANKAIIFIDEIHQLLSDSDSINAKIAEILKPALARGDMRVIGATTTSESTSLLRNPAFNRRFTTVGVPELSTEQTVEIMKNIRLTLQKHHNVSISDDIIEQAVVIGDEYRQAGAHRPDTTITLIDRAMADARINRLELIEKSKNDQMLKQYITANPVPALTINQIKKSARRVLSGDADVVDDRVSRLDTLLNTKIIGQQNAKDELLNTIKRQDLNIVRRKRPISFLFAGPSGTGKTEIARQLADGLFGSRQHMIYINMSEYSHDSALTRITGSSEGYVGSTSKRELPFDSLETRPYQIVLLDEFEKAATNVQRFFMQALDNGSVQTNRGKDIDFSRAIIIATTNAGTEVLSERSVGFGQQGVTKAAVATKQDVLNALKQNFDTELLNRFEHLISFSSLTINDYRKVLAVKFNNIIKEAQENRQDLIFSPLNIDLDKADTFDFINTLSNESYQPDLNGRPAERTMRAYIENQLIDNPNQTQFIFQ